MFKIVDIYFDMFAHQSFYGIIISKGYLEYSARSLVLFEMFFFSLPTSYRYFFLFQTFPVFCNCGKILEKKCFIRFNEFNESPLAMLKNGFPFRSQDV